MLFVTFNDYPGGIYYSQVIDVINYLNKFTSKKIRLVAFISLRNFFNNRQKIKKRYTHSTVLPMFPGVQNWKWNKIWILFLGLIYYKSPVICRGLFAYHLVYPFRQKDIFKRIVLDARGAYKAEFEEYKVIDHPSIIKEIENMELSAINTADFKIAVSNALVKYWEDMYKYTQKNHVIIPCTLSNDFIKTFPEKEKIQAKRNSVNFSEDDIVIVFSGSASAWQSLKYSDTLFVRLMKENKKIKLLLLGKYSLEEYNFFKEFPDRIVHKALENKDVWEHLCIADYGWLVRERSDTNKVAAPVKFAEYLSAGLKVIISDNIGDYSDFCVKNNCGIVLNTNTPLYLSRVGYNEKLKIHKLAMDYFRKDKYHKEYLQILEAINQ